MKTFLALLWKELHEGVKWMAVGLLAMSAGLFFALHLQIGEQRFEIRNGLSVMSSLFLTITTFGSAIVAVMLGLSQTLPENRGDKWGFLAHRPVSRSRLFAAKACSGLIFYVLAVGAPLAVAIRWAATPAHLPVPFEAGMAIPALADMSCGIVYYFAAILTGMRMARWFGSRALGFGVPLFCTVAVHYPQLWQAALAVAIGITLMSVAAWGSFITGGSDRNQPWVTRLAGWFVTSLGVACITMIAMGIIEGLLPSSPIDFTRTGYEVTHEGEIARVVSEGNAVMSVTDVHGTPIPQYQSPANRKEDTITFGVLGEYFPIDVEDAYGRPGYRDTWRYVSAQLGLNRYGPTAWYYIASKNLVAEYDINSARLVGWMGPDGFSAGDSPPADRFDGKLLTYPEYTQNPTLAFRNAVFRVYLDDNRIEHIFSPPSGEQIRSASQAQENATLFAAYGEEARFDIFLTDHFLYAQRANGSLIFRRPPDIDLDDCNGIEVDRALAAKNAPTTIFYQPRWPFLSDSHIEIFQFEKDHVPEQFTVPYPWKPGPPALSDAVVPSVVLPWMSTMLDHAYDWFGIGSWQKPTAAQRRWALVAAAISLLVFASLAIYRSAAYGFSRLRIALWILLIIALGPIGFLIVLCVAERPNRERCPTCGRWRNARQSNCEFCSTAAPPPPLNGTEIFEAALIR